MERHIEWTSPAALWDQFNGATDANQRRVFRTPAILRFASDDFMDQFVALVQSDAQRITELLAVPETWKKPAGDVAIDAPKRGLAGQLERARAAAIRTLEARQGIVRSKAWNTAADELPLKLYQPAHQRYYLVTACLVCRTLGLPDRALDTTKQEKATFVLRMLEPLPGAAAVNPDPAQCVELAHVGNEWKRLDDPSQLADGETHYPLSPLTYTEIDGRRRRMFNGMIPVAKREALAAARTPNPADVSLTPVSLPQMLLKMQVLGPLASLEDVADLALQQIASVDAAPSASQVTATLRTANEQIQTVSWYVLLDLDEWLKEHLGEVWDAITAQSSAGLSGKKLAAYQKLQSLSLVSPLKNIRGWRAALESVKSVYRVSSPAGWPTLSYQFVTATSAGATGLTGTAARAALENALTEALDPQPSVAIPPRAVAQVNATVHRSPWFAVRCVCEVPQCVPLAPPVLSDPTAAFQMAAFFDPDAPARPIRVTMPADTTPAGLRKFDKNTAFVLSDVLCGQVSAVRDLTFGDLIRSVLPWPLHKDLGITPQACAGGGMVCSLSIPIITICALILLMIMVKLLDIVFFWMPFFLICLPVPNFDGKKE